MNKNYYQRINYTLKNIASSMIRRYLMFLEIIFSQKTYRIVGVLGRVLDVNQKLLLTLIIFISSTSFAQIVQTFKGDRFTQYTIDDWISYAPSLHITSIDTDEKFVYFGTANGGILRCNKYTEKWEFPFTVSSGLSSNKIIEVVYNPKDGYLYARTSKGIDVLRFADNFWQKHSSSQLPEKRTPDVAQISNLEKGKNFRFPPFYRPPNDFFPNFFSGRSFMYIPPDEIKDNENRTFKFTDRLTDEWQRVWIGTNGYGVLKADMTTISLYSEIRGIPNISVQDIYLDKNIIWFGGFKNTNGISGITAWYDSEDTWEYFEDPFYSGIAKDDVLDIDGNRQFVAFATVYGVVIYNKNKSKWKTYTQLDGLEGDRVNDVLVHKNTVYIATENGFNWLDLKSKRVEGFSGSPIDNVEINQITILKDTLYLASRLGLYSISLKDKIVQFISSRAAIPDFNLTAINSQKNELWIANNYGIAYLKKSTNSWSSFSDLTIKPNIRDIAFTDSTVWFATDRGLMKYDREMNTWRMFTVKDGLLDNNVYHIDVENDNLWLSTEKGFTIFHHNRAGRLD